MKERPIVLCIGGHDPSGGAGIQADIETAQALGCRATSLITCLTTQDSRDVRALHPLPVEDLLGQLDCLLADLHPQAIKIGLLGSAEVIPPLAERLATLTIPLVLDPVLAAGGGQRLADERLVAALRRYLLPLTTLLTPNRAEARRLAMTAEPDTAARELLGLGAGAVLLTGADEAQGEHVINRLFHEAGERDFNWPLLPHSYHGSGCTLATACACGLARGGGLAPVVAQAQAWTWQTLAHAEHPGHGQWLPHRFPETEK
jgi:hydroxymethylpyrimidine/phosphomethylpyrimidine kinase